MGGETKISQDRLKVLRLKLIVSLFKVPINLNLTIIQCESIRTRFTQYLDIKKTVSQQIEAK